MLGLSIVISGMPYKFQQTAQILSGHPRDCPQTPKSCSHPLCYPQGWPSLSPRGRVERPLPGLSLISCRVSQAQLLCQRVRNTPCMKCVRFVPVRVPEQMVTWVCRVPAERGDMAAPRCARCEAPQWQQRALALLDTIRGIVPVLQGRQQLSLQHSSTTEKHLYPWVPSAQSITTTDLNSTAIKMSRR